MARETVLIGTTVGDNPYHHLWGREGADVNWSPLPILGARLGAVSGLSPLPAKICGWPDGGVGGWNGLLSPQIIGGPDGRLGEEGKPLYNFTFHKWESTVRDHSILSLIPSTHNPPIHQTNSYYSMNLVSNRETRS